MREQAIRIEGTMSTEMGIEQNLKVPKLHAIGVPIEGESKLKNLNVNLTDDKFVTFKALANSLGLSVGKLTAVLINRYITEHVDEVLALKSLRDKL